jgi:hypothetical protein
MYPGIRGVFLLQFFKQHWMRFNAEKISDPIFDTAHNFISDQPLVCPNVNNGATPVAVQVLHVGHKVSYPIGLILEIVLFVIVSNDWHHDDINPKIPHHGAEHPCSQ